MEVVTYSGPDTFGHEVLLPSVSRKNIPEVPKPSDWKIRVYSTDYNPFERVPDVSHMNFVGQADIQYVIFHDLQDIREIVPNTPGAKYAWQVYGKVRIHQGGEYSFCTASDDGSKIYLGKQEIADDDGLHGVKKVCGRVNLTPGLHDLVLVGFQNYGGIYEELTYYGPDTRNHNIFLKSESSSNAPEDVHGIPGEFGMWPPV
eukprot:631195-Hanusia_phi.AAC.1